MSVSRRHHYVPEMLSKRFADGIGKFWYFEQKHARHGVRHVTPDGAFWSPHLNTIERSDGSRDDYAETLFGMAETTASPLLDDILETLRNGIVPLINEGGRYVLGLFVYYQFKRSPEGYVRRAKLPGHENLIRDLAAQFEQKTGGKLNEEDFTALLTGKVTDRIHKAGHVIASTSPDRDIVDQMMQLGLFFCVAPPGKTYVMGSDPVIRFGGRLGELGADIVLPISSDIVMVHGHRSMDGRVIPVTPEAVRSLNLTIWNQSSAIAAASRPLVESLTRRQLRNARRSVRRN